MERVRCACAVGGGIGKRIDDLELLDDRAGPSVVDDERQCILMFRANVDEMDVQSVDPGDEIRQGFQPLLDLAPVVVIQPVVRELLHRLQSWTLRLICNSLLLGPARGRDSGPHILEFRSWGLNREWPDSCGTGWPSGCESHGRFLSQGGKKRRPP